MAPTYGRPGLWLAGWLGWYPIVVGPCRASAFTRRFRGRRTEAGGRGTAAPAPTPAAVRWRCTSWRCVCLSRSVSSAPLDSKQGLRLIAAHLLALAGATAALRSLQVLACVAVGAAGRRLALKSPPWHGRTAQGPVEGPACLRTCRNHAEGELCRWQTGSRAGQAAARMIKLAGRDVALSAPCGRPAARCQMWAQ